MNGAESLVRTLVAGGVDVCFTNPGTSEMHFVAALDRVEGMRCVLGLFEGVVTGAADGYFRMKGTPASTLLHLGPGLANGLANLHNAKKANSGVVNIVGQHATYHIEYNAPLTSDIEGLARPMSSWVRTSPDAKSVARDGAAAIAAAKGAPPQIATLILPADTAWNEADGIAEVPVESQRQSYSPQAVENAAKVLRGGETDLAADDRQRGDGEGIGAGGADRRQDRLQGDGPAGQSADGARTRAVFDRAGALRDRTGAGGAEGLSAHRAGRSQRSRGVFRLSEQAEPAEARGLRGPSHDRKRREFGGGAGGAGLGGRRQAGRCEAAGDRRTGQADRCLDPCVDRPGDRRGYSGECHPRRRIRHDRARILSGDGGRRPARLDPEPGRLDRLFDAGRDRRRDRLSGPQGDLHGRRRQRHVHDPVAVDAGARRPQRRHDRVRQSHLPDPARRVRRRRRRRAGKAGARHAQDRQSDARFRRAWQEHGRAGPRGRPTSTISSRRWRKPSPSRGRG